MYTQHYEPVGSLSEQTLQIADLRHHHEQGTVATLDVQCADGNAETLTFSVSHHAPRRGNLEEFRGVTPTGDPVYILVFEDTISTIRITHTEARDRPEAEA
jgi:hypothetical protein